VTEGTPIWFGPDERPLFGWVHAPDNGRSDGAVVLCPPLARELTSAHFAYRRLARALAAAGLTAVRFDYDGTGDSAGDDDDPDRLGAWLASVDEAIALARRTGAERVSLVGMRIGALLALRAGACNEVSAAVLWDPCSSGRRFLKEQRAMYLVNYGSDDRPAVDAGPDQPVELPGYRYTAETAGQIQALTAPAPGAPTPPRLLVLTRRGRRPAPDLAAGLAAAAVEWEEIDGQDELLDVEPLRQRLPDATIDRITAWLRDATLPSDRPVTVPASGDARVAAPGGITVVERARRLGEVGLFGIETAPADGSHLGPTVLMLTAGNDWHAGPNRLWVVLARRWAALGVRSLRFDASGLGDSPVRPGQPEHVVRAPEAFDDVAIAAESVEPDDPSNVVLLGLCSGGYQALDSALALLPRAALSVNPVLRFNPPEAATGAVDPRRRIHLPIGTLGRVVRRRGPVALRRLARVLGWWATNRLRPGGPASWLGELVAGGVDVLCICGEHEGRQLLEGSRRSVDRLAATGRLRVDVVAGLDHALLPWEQREAIADILTRHLVDHVLVAGGGCGSATPAPRRREPAGVRR